MAKFCYPIVALIFNYILFESFPFGGEGTGMGLFITIPIIMVISFAATGIHYLLEKRGRPRKYFRAFSIIGVVVISYMLFITESDNRPFDVIQRMCKTNKKYDSVTISDFFLEDRYFNYEKIVAAEKKFSGQINDTSFSVRVSNAYDFTNVSEIYGITYKDGWPVSTDKSVIVGKVASDTFRFQQNMGSDTFVYYGNGRFISKAINKSDSIAASGRAYPGNTKIRRMSTSMSFKDRSPDTKYFAYKIFYYFL